MFKDLSYHSEVTIWERLKKKLPFQYHMYYKNLVSNLLRILLSKAIIFTEGNKHFICII